MRNSEGLAGLHASHSKARNWSLSVVVPCKNEEVVLRETHRRLTAVLSQLSLDFEIIYVDDGSTDSTAQLLRNLCADGGGARALFLSRNFGHQMATTAGLEHASGEGVVIIDADLQDPPEIISEMVARWQEGYDVVYGVRTDRVGESVLKLWTAKLFYRLINQVSNIQIPLDAGDFRLMDRKVVNALLAMPECDRFIRGMVSWLGYRQVAVPYARAARFAGSSKYPTMKMVRFAMDGILSFSIVPLKLATWVGFLTSFLALLGFLYALGSKIFTNHWVAGWTSLFSAVLFLGGVQLTCLGIVGEYVGRIYGETKQRPLYFVQDRLGFEESCQDSVPQSASHSGEREARLTQRALKSTHTRVGG
jgi:glycosyltransferase involved in cell wall biosynthesis